MYGGAGSRPPVAKWTPGKPTPVHWYSLDRFEHRVLLELRARSGDHGRPVRRAVRRPQRPLEARPGRRGGRPAIRAPGRPARRVRDRLAAAPTQVLFEAMRAEAREPKPAVLGAVGKEWLESGSLRRALKVFKGLPRALLTAYTTVLITASRGDGKSASPTCPAPTGRILLVGQNYSPAIAPQAMLMGAVTGCPHHLRADRADRSDRAPDQPGPAHARLRQEPPRPRLPERRRAPRGDQRRSPSPVDQAARPRSRGTSGRDLRPSRAAHVDPGRRRQRAARRLRPGELPTAPTRSGRGRVYYAIRPRVLELTGKKALGDAYFSVRAAARVHAGLTRS